MLAAAVLSTVLATLSASAGLADAQPSQAAPALGLVSPPTIVKGDEPYRLRLRTVGAPEGATLGLTVHEPFASRLDFRDTLDDQPDLGDAVHEVPARPVARGPGGGGVTEIGFAPGEAGLRQNVYPVEAQLQSADGEVLARAVTYLAYVPGDTPEFQPLQVAVVVDIAGPQALQPDGEVQLDAVAAAHARQRAEAVQLAGDARVTLAPAPETLEALADDEARGGAIVEQLSRLAQRHRVLARPFVDVDLGTLLAADLPREPNAQAEAGADVVRTRLGVEPVGGVWLAGATWGEASARVAAQLGIGRAVVPPSAVDGGDSFSLRYNPARAGDEGPTAMVSDPDLAAHLTGDDGMIGAHRFLAELAITWLEAPSNPRAVVVRLPPDENVDPEVVGAALAELDDQQVVIGVPVRRVFDDIPAAEDGPGTLTLVPDPAGPDLTDVAPELRLARAQVSGVGSVLDDPDEAAGLDHSLLLATGTATPDAERAAYIEHATDALDSVRGAVSLPPEFRITLTTRSSTIPVRVTNNRDENVRVRVSLESDQLEFPEGSTLEEELPPGTTSLDVPVRARTSGAFTLDVRVTSRDGSLLLDQSTFDIRSTAISGVGLILSVGAGLFLAVWWARNWRKSRRVRNGDGPAAGPITGGDAGIAAPPDPDAVVDLTGPRAAPAVPPRSPATAPGAPSRGAAGHPPILDLAPWAKALRHASSPATPPPATAGQRPETPTAAPRRPAPTTPAPPPPTSADDTTGYRPAHMARSGHRRRVRRR